PFDQVVAAAVPTCEAVTLCSLNRQNLWWTFAQMFIAHHSHRSFCRRTGKLSSGGGGQGAIPRHAVMPAPSAVAGCSARIPTMSLFLLGVRRRRPSLLSLC